MGKDTKHILNIVATIVNAMLAVFMVYAIGNRTLDDRTLEYVFITIIVMIFMADFRNYINTAIPTKDDK